MITRKAIREEVVDVLRGLHGSVAVYDGVTPHRLETYATGEIKPYIIVWVGHGSGLGEMEHLGALADVDSVRASIQTQIVAANERDVWDVAELVQGRLTNHLIGGHPVKPDDLSQPYAAVMVDENVTPHRRFLPLLWNINTQ